MSKQQRHFFMIWVLLLGVLSSLIACNASQQPPVVEETFINPFAREGEISIRGYVILKGTPPTPDVKVDTSGDRKCKQYGDIYTQNWVVDTEQRLADVVISVVGPASQTPRPGSMLVDQRGCCYKPHVLSASRGEAVVFRNSDDTFHNVRVIRHQLGTLHKGQNLENYGQRPQVQHRYVFAQSGIYRLECDIHRWMRCWIYVHDNPYHAVTNRQGEFQLPGRLADGKYQVKAWHSQFAEPLMKEVIVQEGKGEVHFEFDASVAMVK